MKLFVTGGAGFIGSNFARHVLHHSDDSVVVYDALTYAGNIANLADLRDDPRFTFVEGDICDREAVRAAMTGCDRVVHFAAETHVDRSLLGPDVFVRTNCDGTNVLCDTATQLGGHSLVEPVRAVPIPREAHSVLRDHAARRRARAALRRRAQRA